MPNSYQGQQLNQNFHVLRIDRFSLKMLKWEDDEKFAKSTQEFLQYMLDKFNLRQD